MRSFRAVDISAVLNERLALMAPSRRLRLAMAERLAALQAGGKPARLLDAGCGDGLLALAIAARHPDWTVAGIDVDGGLLGSARARAAARNLANVEFLEADLTRELPAGGFDVVIAMECLTEIPDDAGALRAMAAALAPGGLLIAQVPDANWRPILPGSAPTWRNEVRHGYGAAELEQALASAGLTEIAISPTFHTVAMVAQEIRDRLKDSGLAVRLLAFPFMLLATRLELWGIRFGRANALIATAIRRA